MTITEFLEARIAEDEDEAEQNLRGDEHDGAWSDDHVRKVFAECAAKRAIIAAHQRQSEDDDPCAWIVASEALLGTLAAIYKDHQDYQQEWALTHS